MGKTAPNPVCLGEFENSQHRRAIDIVRPPSTLVLCIYKGDVQILLTLDC